MVVNLDWNLVVSFNRNRWSIYAGIRWSISPFFPPLHVLCRMPNGKNVEIKDYTLHDAVEEYLKVKGTVNPVLDGRSIAVDLGTNAFSQMAETGYKFR